MSSDDRALRHSERGSWVWYLDMRDMHATYSLIHTEYHIWYGELVRITGMTGEHCPWFYFPPSCLCVCRYSYDNYIRGIRIFIYVQSSLLYSPTTYLCLLSNNADFRSTAKSAALCRAPRASEQTASQGPRLKRKENIVMTAENANNNTNKNCVQVMLLVLFCLCATVPSHK